MFLFPPQTKVWPLCLLFLSLSLSLSLCPCLPPISPPSPSLLSLPLSLHFSVFLRVDNVSANDLTALVEAPSSNWTSRDWVLYRKTIVILSQISTTLRISTKHQPRDWTFFSLFFFFYGLLREVWMEERNQVGFLSPQKKKKKRKKKSQGKMDAINFLCRMIGMHVSQDPPGGKVQPWVVLGWLEKHARERGLVIIYHKYVLTNSAFSNSKCKACANYLIRYH